MADELQQMIATLQQVKETGLAELGKLDSLPALHEWDTRYLGRNKGELTAATKGMKDLSGSERPQVGKVLNEVKNTLQSALDMKRGVLKLAEQEQQLETERLDVTLPGRPHVRGNLHLITRTQREIARIFRGMGFEVAEGPEVELDYYNFQALNIPADHPARDMWDTFWIVPGQMLLRTHTSPVQARVMEKIRPPVRVIVPGKVYRYEAVDATHESMFYQVEGLLIDEHCTMADLKGVLARFAREMFGEDRKVRFRASYFPFTEPSAEVDINCLVCNGTGCRACKYSGWLEILGSGMVHPQVLRNVHYDPERYRGFAFGLGIDRVAMLKYGIDDVRLSYGNDLRFLQQFA